MCVCAAYMIKKVSENYQKNTPKTTKYKKVSCFK